MREELIGKIMLWFIVALLLGAALAWYRYPFFLAESAGGWEIKNPSSTEGNLLVVAALLIGVTVVQGQNLNRLLDIRHTAKSSGKRLSDTGWLTYDYLRIGFWLLALDALAVVILLVFAIALGPGLAPKAAFVLAMIWWSAIVLILAGWFCLAIVAAKSYSDS